MATYAIFTTVCLVVLLLMFEREERIFQDGLEALMDEVEYIAENPIDVMRMSVGEAVEGPWWHVGGETTEFVVKAASVDHAKELVRQSGSYEVLIAYQMRQS